MTPEPLTYFYYNKASPEDLSGNYLDCLLALGWFRMRQTIFTTSHIPDVDLFTLKKVWWLRYEVNQIRSHASHRAIYKMNHAFRVSYQPFETASPEEEALFNLYREHLPFQTFESLHDALFSEEPNSIYTSQSVRIHDGNRLIALGIFDIGDTAAASIIHCYDPEYKKFSLGKYLMLLTINFLKKHHFQYYYPGYMMSGNARLDYKLFLGKEVACYYDAIHGKWLPFQEHLLEPVPYTEEDVIRFLSL